MQFIIILIISLICVYLVIGNLFYNIALNSNKSKSLALKGLKIKNNENFNHEKFKKWFEDNMKENYINSTKDNLKLHGYEFRNKESDIWTIIIHGYMSEGKRMALYAQEFYNKGYNVLVVDLRGHGKSQGNYIGMGVKDRFDIIDWCNYIIKENCNSQIIIFGVSMGASTVMMTTGEFLPNNVKIAIEDCGYSSIWNQLGYRLNQLFKLPKFPILNAANTICKIRAGYSLKEGNVIEKLKKSSTPTLFIHGSEDNFVPFEMLDEVYNAASCEKEKLIIKGAGHIQSASVNPELYWYNIERFIDKYLKSIK